jgi:predicted methyltransferase
LHTNFDYTELQLHDGGVRWRELRVKKVVFCEGAVAVDNPWFCWLPFQLCKGDVISLHSESALPKKIINDGYWLLPVDGNTVKVGATYEWQWLTEQPSETSRQALLEAFQRMMGSSAKASILEHQSGIRPTTRDKHPFIGDHPLHKQLAIFNGFGSKGALLIPQCARQFVNALLSSTPLTNDAIIDRFAHGKSMVTLAKLFISEHINLGDVAIDATVGNGYDAEFLARCVGAQGHVYGFDIQQQAIANTQNRLRGLGLERRVTLFKAGHESMEEHLDENLRGHFAAIMFNLGYLPGGDKSLQTQTKTTLNALTQSLNLLKVGGIITVVTYSGHTGGDSETRDVSNWLKELSSDGNQRIDVDFVLSESNTASAPGLIKIIRKH